MISSITSTIVNKLYKGSFGMVYRNNAECSVSMVLVMHASVMLILFLLKCMVWCSKHNMHFIISKRIIWLQKYPSQVWWK